MSLHDQFVAFSKFGDTKSNGETITLSQNDKWMKQAKIIDGRKITLVDTGFCFSKFKAYKISYNDWLKFLEIFAEYKNLSVDDLKEKLVDCGLPGTQNEQKDASGVGSKADVSKFRT